MVEKALQFIQKHNLIKQNSTIVVGLSGGPDSVCLLHILKQLESPLNIKLIAAHLDHEWRDNSVDDMLFCKKYADSLSVSFAAAKASEIQTHKKYNGSKEEQARFLRRTFFESVILQHDAHSVALGHHTDDQQETFFLRLIRGASIAGLAGIKPYETFSGLVDKRQMTSVIRPLLPFCKQEILDYLKQNFLRYVQDITNADTELLRNAIRIQVIPALRACDDRFNKTFEKSHKHIQDTDEFISRLTEKMFAEITKTIDGDLWLDTKQLFSCDPFLHHGLILRWLCIAKVPFTPSTAFFDEIIRFLKNSGLQHQPSKSWFILKKDDYASLKK